MHCTTGETPAKLMFGRNLRSRLDLIVPSNESRVASSVVPGKRNFVIGDVVWTRWYSARRETWQLGKIKDKVGNKMYSILIIDLDQYCIRHVDQIFRYTGNNIQPTKTNIGAGVSHQFQSPNFVSGMVSNVPQAVNSPGATATDEAPVEPIAECSADGGDGEEWGDCEVTESEGTSAVNIAPVPLEAEIPGSKKEQPVSTTARNIHVPAAPSPLLSRQKRPRNNVDYKKYF